MWLWLAIGSALLLGVYDVAKKQSLKSNDTYYILAYSTGLTALFLLPFITLGTLQGHLFLMAKAILVSASWVSGMLGLKLLPITTASTIKASRPVFVILFSLILFGERLNILQWCGVACVLVSLWLLSRSSKKEGIDFSQHKGIFYMAVSVLTGVASALYDKHIIKSLDPLFVQSWTNIYITLILVLMIVWKKKVKNEEIASFRWDWTILLIAIFITGADFMYFWALKCDGSLLSVVSIIRRASVIVTFGIGALMFKEKRIKDKAVDLAVMLGGMVFLVLGSC